MKPGPLRIAIKWYLQFILRIFFRRIEVVGLEKIPSEGPVMFVLNHPNGLVDPIFPLCFNRREVSFLAKAPLFKTPLVSWFTKALDSIPVYRQQDDASQMSKNADTFEKTRALLEKGGTIVIFPEGVSHSDPKMRPLKSGAARIALGANLPLLKVVPGGLYYTAKKTFRSSALLQYGEPILVERTELGEDGDPPRSVVRQLTDRIKTALSEVTVQAESEEALRFADRAEKILNSPEWAANLGSAMQLRKSILLGYRSVRETESEQFARLEEEMGAFELLITRYRLDHPEAHPGALKRQTSLRGGSTLIRDLFWFTCILPFSIFGILIHYPTYRWVGWLAIRLSQTEEDLVATYKALGAMLFFPLTWITLGCAVGLWLTPWAGALCALGLFPACGYMAVVFVEHLSSLRARLWSLLFGLTRRNISLKLQAEQKRIGIQLAELFKSL